MFQLVSPWLTPEEKQEIEREALQEAWDHWALKQESYLDSEQYEQGSTGVWVVVGILVLSVAVLLGSGLNRGVRPVEDRLPVASETVAARLCADELGIEWSDGEAYTTRQEKCMSRLVIHK